MDHRAGFQLTPCYYDKNHFITNDKNRFTIIKKKQKQLRLKRAEPLKNNKPQQKVLKPLHKLNTSEKVVTSNSTSSSSSHTTKE